jgi:hypothetical protein
MGEVRAQVTREMSLPLKPLKALVWDYRLSRRRMLPEESFSDYRVMEGGEGPGTVYSYTLKAARRERPYRMRVEQTQNPDQLLERDENSSFRTVWTLAENPGPGTTVVSVSSRWEGAGGIGGFFERLFAPRALGRLYGAMLDRLERMAREEVRREEAGERRPGG